MERTNFEKLRVYKLSEHLADKIWDVVKDWDYLAKDTVGKQMIKAGGQYWGEHCRRNRARKSGG